MKKILMILGFLAILLHTTNARAFSSPLCAEGLQAWIPAVSGAGQLPIVGALGTGSVTITTFMAAYLPWIYNLEDCVQQSIVTAIITQAQTQQQVVQEQAKAAFGRTQQLFENQAVLRKTTEFGNSFIPPGTCAHDVGTSYSGGVSSYAARIGQAIHAGTDAYDTIRPTQPQTLKVLAAQPPTAFSSSALFGSDDIGPGTTLSGAQIQNGANFINNVTHPIPFSPLPANKASTLQGQKQYLQELSDNGLLSMSHHVLSQILALRTASPTALQTWDSYMQAQTGNTSLQNPGQVSMMRLFGDTASSRFMNHQWYKTITNYPRDKAIRETASIEAFNSELLYQVLVALQNLEGIEAVRLSRTVKQQ